MSIFPAVVDMLRAEHRYRPITGDVLLIGRQTIEFSDKTDEEFFSQFDGIRFHALDVSDYEGADIIWDLNVPIPITMNGICDFIFDGSCLDNIFDPAAALRSFSKMLRPGGRMMLMEHGTAIHGALTSFSPEWFFNYFAINDYNDCQISLCTFPDGMWGGWECHSWVPFAEDDVPVSASPAVPPAPQRGIGDFVSMVLAEKGECSSSEQSPVQAQYRLLHGADNARYLEAHRRYLASGRRA